MTAEGRETEADRMGLAARAEESVTERVGADADSCTCDELLDHLFEFLDDEVDDGDCTRFRRHIATCPTCTEAAHAEQHIREMVRRSCAEVAPSSLRLRVVAQLTVLSANGVRAGE
ncbi:mycothiol system anti-sigma-R factor [Georgenia sp. TF02-10]|uniref:mycothiol system anti-sigma-R factor n=1 Tax=Georgenia sp. TF02-10 TaxID=2917725 RepID=UPI001FA7A680|nr:mycothiol system anti-sigma-R factor [Georgenia sp. TF02-10]UNX54011.1 mycothiol system anti-sigma-R factor [Georgenia sp. TF02-10]